MNKHICIYKKFIFLFLIMHVCVVCVNMSVRAYKVQKVSDPLELDSCNPSNMGVRNKSLVLCKSSMWSKALNHLSISVNNIF